jgi:hypothetical protein
MVHKNFQEAIAQLSTDDDFRSTLRSNPEEIKSNFDLNEEDMKAMNSHNSKVTPRPGTTVCCCCC